MQIYLLQDGEKRGPLTIYEVAEEVRAGKADADTLGWFRGSDGWGRLEELSPTASLFVEPPPRPETVRAEGLAEMRARLAPERAHSVVRLLARLIDLFLLGTGIFALVLASGLVRLVDLVNDTNPEMQLMMQLLVGATLMVLEGFLIFAVGTTPGKWLLRVRVTREGGGRIPLATSFRRSFTVWWRGVGFWLLLLSMITMALAQASLLGTGKTPWDRACGLEVSYGKIDRNRVLLIIVLLLGLSLLMGIAFEEQMQQMREALEAAKKQ